MRADLSWRGFSPKLCPRVCYYCRVATCRSGGVLDGDETDIVSMRYTEPMLNAIATENIVIGTLAGLGVIVLVVMVVFVVKRIVREE